MKQLLQKQKCARLTNSALLDQLQAQTAKCQDLEYLANKRETLNQKLGQQLEAALKALEQSEYQCKNY